MRLYERLVYVISKIDQRVMEGKRWSDKKGNKSPSSSKGNKNCGKKRTP